jgi:hypothetical protein
MMPGAPGRIRRRAAAHRQRYVWQMHKVQANTLGEYFNADPARKKDMALQKNYLTLYTAG